jgi:transposase-like protein
MLKRPRPSARWHLHEMVVRIGGERMYLWRAVDDEGEILDMLVQRRRDKRAAVKLMRTLLKKQGFAPATIVTDSLVTDLQTALRQQILGITVAQGEAQIEPDRVPDDKLAESGGGRMKSAAWLSLASFGHEPCVNVSTPAGARFVTSWSCSMPKPN